MKAVYVDASVIVANALRQPGYETGKGVLARAERVISAALTEAEVASALLREGRPPEVDEWLLGVDLINPARPLRREVRAVLNAGHLRGADTWHVATALWFHLTRGVDIEFLTLDRSQRAVAKALGFKV